MVRKKGVLSLLILVGLFFLLSYFLTDRWLESRLENLGESIIGAKVEIDGLNFSFTQVLVSWERLQVTDPQKTMQNMLETGVCRFDMEFWPLLSKKIIIEDFRIENLRTGTPRETDGKLPEPPPEEPGYIDDFISTTVEKLNKEVAPELPVTSLDFKQGLNVDSLMRVLDLKSPERIKALQKELNNTYKEWQTRLSDLTFDKDLKKIENQAKAIKPDRIKTLDQVQKTIVRVNEIKTTLDKINRQINASKSAFTKELEQTGRQLTQIDDWIAEDYARAMSLAKLPDFSLQNIAGMLFGRQIVNRVSQYLSYVGTVRHYAALLQSGQPKKEKPPRLKGQDIRFYEENARPDFWIKQILISGQTNDGLPLQGEIVNITSNQTIIGQPTSLTIKGGKEKSIHFNLNGVLDYRKEIPQEKFRLQYAGFSLAGTRLSESPLLPNTIRKGYGTLDSRLDLTGAQLSAKVKFTARDVQFDFSSSKPKKKLEQILQEALSGIRSLDFAVNIFADSSHLRFSVQSSLDKILADRLKGTVSRELEAAKKQLKDRIDKEVGKYKNDALKLADKNEKEIRAKIAEYEQLLEDQNRQINLQLKEIEKKIDEQKNKLGKDVGKKIMDLFK
ncbi:MAG TPA: TIGR03545 family protein [Caldithrix abyssi]|uniref:TIGR03545 family protein n=1 Tax=Caldithrix abyssi TaxID=187145 RepID=A0A7V4U0Y9_CALAY|nr:TIGR03545 family protein [Caldithrix abyssi]